MDMEKAEKWLSTIPSKSTRKNYLAGIRKFESYYQKPIETLIGSENSGEVIERYYAWLKDKGHPQNTRRNLCNVAIQFLKFFKTPVDYNKHLGIYRTVITTKDHLVTISEVQELAKVADLREQILLECYLLGLRIGDVSTLEWKTFDVQGEAPIPIMIHCGKEETTASTFVSEEFQQLLQKYIPQLDKPNVERILGKKIKDFSFNDQYEAFSVEVKKRFSTDMPILTMHLRKMRVKVLHEGYNPEPEEKDSIVQFTIGLLRKLDSISDAEKL